MRKFFSVILTVLSLGSFAQTDSTIQRAPRIRQFITQQATNNNPEPDERYQRISFIAGVGTSYITRRLYADPVVNPSDNTVQIENAERVKTNLTLGVSYLFGKGGKEKVLHSSTQITSEGVGILQEQGKRFQSGFTFALFINPLLFNKITETQNFFNITDYGFGFGHTFSEGLAVLGTAEFFSVNQPRAWFVNQFKDKNIPYTVGNAIQKTIDVTDRNIFSPRVVMTFGIKFCYSFNTMKHFVSTTTGSTDENGIIKSGSTPTTTKTYF